MIRESSTTILVIEDDATTGHLFLEGLEAEGFVTIAAQNGEVGIRKAQEHLPDLVICDLLMPDMDGYSVLTQLRQHPLTAIIPFIFLTASNSKASMRKAMELGADDYLSKPATVDELLKAISIRLEKQSLLRSWYGNHSHQVEETVPQLPPGILGNSELIFPNISHLKKVFDYIEAHFHQGITLSDVAEAVGYSPAYLTNQVSKQTGTSINTWIVKRRMAAACSLLKSTNLTIEEIATKIGYQNACHFSRQFSQHHKLSPTIWRKQHQLLQVSASANLQFIKSRPQLTNPVPC